MDYLSRIRQILTEGYNFTNADEVISAIRSNQIGVKIQPWFKEPKNSKYFKYFKNFFKNCENFGIKDTTYGVQILCSKTGYPGEFDRIIQSDSLYEFLKSYKKPWVKQLPEYQEFINYKTNGYPSSETFYKLHNLEKAIQEEQSKHGKATKGSGALKDVKVLYDDGTWKLMVPSSFEGEKAIAFYGKDGNETPTHWCTRANENYYKHYTQFGPLYVIRNMKTGKAYQLAFMENKVEFLDQDDEKGDEITRGDLAAIPDELLKHIKDPGGNRTLLDYKKSKMETDKDTKLPKNKILRADAKTTSDLYHDPFENEGSDIHIPQLKLGKEIDLGNGVCKKEILNYTAEEDIWRYDYEDIISSYFKKNGNGKYVRKSVNLGQVNKDKAILYYLKKNPKIAVVFAVEKGAQGKKHATFSYTSNEFHDLGTKEEKKLLGDVSMEDFGTTKYEKRKEAARNELILKRARIDRYFNVGDRSEATRFRRYNAFVDKANENVDYSNSKIFEKLHSFQTPNTRQGTVVTELSFVPKHSFQTANMEKGNWEIYIRFIDEDREEAKAIIQWDKSNRSFGVFDAVPFTKAKNAVALIADHSQKIILLDENEFKIAKKAAFEIQKQILKIPGYKQYNMERRVKEFKNMANEVEDARPSQETQGKSRKQLRREAEDVARNFINQGFERDRPPVYESVNYFDY